MHNNSPSILPYAADVFIKWNKPQLLCIFTEEIQIEQVNDDVYDRFFENHTIPKGVEKKLQNY